MATLVEGDQKTSFSIVTTSRYKGGLYFIHGLLHFTLDPYLIMLSVKQGRIKNHFLSLLYDSARDWTPVFRTIGEGKNFTNLYWILTQSFLTQWDTLLTEKLKEQKELAEEKKM